MAVRGRFEPHRFSAESSPVLILRARAETIAVRCHCEERSDAAMTIWHVLPMSQPKSEFLLNPIPVASIRKIGRLFPRFGRLGPESPPAVAPNL
jgi:hypothetical protein